MASMDKRGTRPDTGAAAKKPTGRPSAGGGDVKIDTLNRAIGDVRYIRDLLDASHDFFVSGWSGVAAGIVTVAGAAVTALVMAHPERWDIPGTLWILWAVVGILLALSDFIFFARRCREVGRPIFSGLLVKIVASELVMTAQGLILTLVFIKISMPEYIPAAWLLGFGATFAALGLYIPGGLWVLGATTIVASIAAFIVPAGGIWCVGFAGGAMCLWGAAYLITRGR
jgi:hypothetical protein